MVSSHNENATEMVERIVAAARDVVRQEGAAALTIRRVARATGQSVGTVGYYFASKQALIDACLDPQNELVFAQIGVLRQRLGAEGADVPLLFAQAVRLMFSIHRSMRETLRLRMLTLLQQRELPDRTRSTFMHSALDQLGVALSEALEVDIVTARLYVQSVSTLVMRYALFLPDDLAAVVGEQSADAAAVRTEEHIVWVARTLAANLRVAAEGWPTAC